jgi:hypothetical protein
VGKGEKLALEYISQAFKLHYRIFRIFNYGRPGFPAPIFMNYEQLIMFDYPLFKAFLPGGSNSRKLKPLH